MSQISISGLTFAYDGSYDNIFENITFNIDTDWRLGFTGRNGRGKTTFLNLLMGRYEYSGTISSSVSFDYFPFAVDDESLNAIEIFYQLCPQAEEWQIYRELSLLDVEDDILYRQFSSLTGGERTKLLLSALFLKENSFLLIDEPTNHLDMHARKIMSDYLNTKKGFILVSHDRAFLDNSVDHILSINKTNIEIQRGSFSSWQHNKELQDNFEFKQNDKLKKDIKRLNESADRTAKWSDSVEKSKIGTHAADRGAIGHKAAKMMKRSKVTENRQLKAAEDKVKLLKNIESSDNLQIKQVAYHSNNLIDISQLAVCYSDKPVFENVQLTVNRGDRIALSGRNGSGKSSIIKILLGEDIPYSGNVKIASNLIISYVSQDTSGLCGHLDDYAQEKDIDESLFKAILRKLDFSRIQFEKDISDFSCGQKKKVLIATSLCQKAHLYIWDEPLNFIDVLSRIQIEDLILKNNPTMLFVEHDITFTEKVATSIVELV